MKRWLAFLLLSAALAACDQPIVEVDSAAPFPRGATDVRGFAPRQRGQYVAADGTDETLLLSESRLLRQRWQHLWLTGHQLDSLGLPRREGTGRQHSRQYRVRPLAADSFQVSWQEPADTLWLAGAQAAAHLRRQREWYYLSFPSAEYPGRWQVQRLAVADGQLTWQELRPDSLRLQALDSSAFRLQREPHRLHFTLRLFTPRAQRQLGRYAGLWQTLGNYQRQSP